MSRSNFPHNQANDNTTTPFFIALLAGVISIILLKTLGVHQAIVTLVPVGVMLVYAGYVYYFRKYRLRLDQAGDNLYYLGFLFTLTSLAYSLYEFSNNDSAAASIITNFGIAISTTIVGLFFRVLFSQMRADPIETEQLARVELADASRHLRTELDDAAREFSMFRRTLHQMIADTFQELQETIDKKMQGGLNRFESSVKRFSDTVEDTNKGLEIQSKALSESTDFLIKSISSLAERINTIQLSDDILERQLQPAIDKISEVVDIAKDNANVDRANTKAWAELSVKVAAVINGIHKSLKGAQDSSILFIDGAKSVQSAAEHMSSLAVKMEAVDSTVGSIADTSEREFKRVVETVIYNLDELSQQLSSQVERISQVASDKNAAVPHIASIPQNPSSPQAEPHPKKKNEARPSWWRLFGRSTRPGN